MDNIARLLPMERSQIFSETAALMGTTPAIFEVPLFMLLG
jgi:hypothetical protein